MVKLKKLHIKNLQSVKDCTILFEENGVYHLAGKHNIGKSAIIKAINALFQNVSRYKYRYYIRDNSKSFQVTGEFWDGGVVTLSRGENDYYEWDTPQGKGVYNRTDGKVPDELIKYFNLYIDTEKTKECLNIRTPRSVLLYVDTTVSDNYYLFQKALRTEEFVLATRLANKKKNEISSKIRTVKEFKENQSHEYESETSEYNDTKHEYDELNLFHKRLKQNMKNYNEMKDFVQLASLVSRLNKQLDDMNIGSDIDSLIKEVGKELKKLQVIKNIIDLQKELIELNNVRDENKEIIKQTQDIEKDIKFVQISSKVVNLDKDVNNIENEIETFKEVNKVYTELNITISKFKLYDSYVNINDKLNISTKELNKVIEVNKLHKELSKQMVEYKEVHALLNRASSLKNTVMEFKIAKEEYENADKDMTDFMKENKFCPIVAMTKDLRCPFGEVI